MWAQLEPENTGSSRICERLGMRRKAFFEKGSWSLGQWTDLTIYATAPTSGGQGSGPMRVVASV